MASQTTGGGPSGVPASAIQSFGWNGSEWAPPASPGDWTGGKLRLATLNILGDFFPWFMELAIASGERFAALCEEVKALDATILAMNEVTPNALRILLADEFVRSQYFVTELPDLPNGSIKQHGCLILSKLPFLGCYRVDPDVEGGRSPVAGVFDIGGRRVAVCSLHTMAYQTPKARAVRAKQIARVDEFLRGLQLDGGYYIVGDLNLHYICEDSVAPENSLLDLWAETHFGEEGDKELGFTFDAETNTMIHHYLPSERRRMRLDRMLGSQNSFLAPQGLVRLWGHKAVDERREIFLSDHYGLVVDLESVQASFQGSAMVKQLLERNGQAEMAGSGFSSVRFAGALVYHVLWLAPRTVGYW